MVIYGFGLKEPERQGVCASRATEAGASLYRLSARQTEDIPSVRSLSRHASCHVPAEPFFRFGRTPQTLKRRPAPGSPVGTSGRNPAGLGCLRSRAFIAILYRTRGLPTGLRLQCQCRVIQLDRAMEPTPHLFTCP